MVGGGTAGGLLGNLGGDASASGELDLLGLWAQCPHHGERHDKLAQGCFVA